MILHLSELIDRGMEAKTQEWNVSSYENVGLMPRLLFFASSYNLAFAMLTPPLPPPPLPPLPLHIPPQLPPQLQPLPRPEQ